MRPSLAVAAFFLAAAAVAQVPSPKEFLGHEVGADYQLCNYTDMVRYFRAIDAVSDRVVLHDIGSTSYGQRMVMAVITSPENHRRLDRIREISRRLCHAKGLDEAAARALAAEGRAVVWIDAGLHSTEAIAGQNLIELVWQMSSRNDEEVQRILDEVVLLACPVNPDGYELVANAYRATRSMTIPVLYQRYIGHDNNRDFYACNQIEATNVNRVFYTDWCPQIVYNHHQTAPANTIIFVPPFRDPFNYLTDPLVIRGIEIVSAHMTNRFCAEGKPGVISRSGAPYSGWWNGGLRSTCYFHNIIGILTESFGRPEPTPIRQPLDRRLPYGDYPDPVPPQTWHARQTVEYLQTANFAILDYAARHRAELLRNSWFMGNRSIQKGSTDQWTPTPALVGAARRRDEPDSVFSDPMLRDPRVYVLPADQMDFNAAVRLVQALRKNGVEVLRATAPFSFNGVAVPAGSFVIKTAQAFRAHVLDQFEPQFHPDDIKDGKPVPPYDAAGWTYAMQMDVAVLRGYEDLPGPFEPVIDHGHSLRRTLPVAAAGWQLDPRDSHTVIAINRLLRADRRVEWSPRGFFFVPRDDGAAEILATAGDALGVAAVAVAAETREAREALRRPRIGLFDVFGGHMPTGWDQWILKEFEFGATQVFGDRVEAGDLLRDYDALVFHTGLPGPRDLERMATARDREPEALTKLAAALPKFEDWSNLASRATRLTGEQSLPALRAFVEGGGTLIALGGECDKVIRHFGLPVKVGTHIADASADGGERRTTREEFYIPGSLLAMQVDTGHPLAKGMPAELATMFNNGSAVLEVTDPNAPIDVVARWRGRDTLVSGWAIGEEFLVGKAAVLCARVGKGRVVLFGADATYRGQPLASFKLFFHALLTAAK
ncbi:MAG: peptidase [Planctomycetes bacterium]|nr:peptidase [Planctomycetota bacterium]